ncbi:Non-specific serine/threonine protein kinase protein [Dioscorea alata]|uniref:Non-specific serine/threonine protein kinase protein n=1 Tax=Dioscorea alata TaxID=55571 RepID=A0ACB7V7G5_DIOAL|nr:Non-specific serine/threonine protein kinase protein [Dioscorea alata]
MNMLLLLVILVLLELISRSSCSACIEGERRALLEFKKHIQDPNNKLSSWLSGQDCCSWEGVHCDNLTGNIVGLELRGPDRRSYESFSLHYLQLRGQISPSLLQLQRLNYLDLSHNYLRYLDLSYSYFNGPIPATFGNLSKYFTPLEKLETLDISYNSLVFNVSSNWVPPFLLNELRISSCSVGPEFPTWLQTQHKLNALDLSQNGISSTVPDWFWNLTTHNLIYLDLSHNQIKGMIPEFLTFIHIEYFDLSSNLFSGPLPDLHMHSPTLHGIYLSNNSFSGPIPRIIVNNPFYLEISISMNKLNASVPDWFCQMKKLSSIDISKNHLSDNNIAGGIPNSICHLPHLKSLFLSHNKLSGEFPNSLKNCSQLVTLDLMHNNFTGSIPNWIGGHLPSLMFLMLKGNAFVNHIPQEISQLKYLQILDLSSNHLSGPISKCLLLLFFIFLFLFFAKMSGLAAKTEACTSLGGASGSRARAHMGAGTTRTQPLLTLPEMCPHPRFELSPLVKGFIGDPATNRPLGRWSKAYYWIPVVLHHGGTMLLSLKGREDEYGDLGSLSGKIPEELASLYGLQSLNLSGNTLEGEIPDKLGRMQQLESLDLHLIINSVLVLSENYINFSVLVLSENYINFSEISWVFNIKSLQYLDLSSNGLHHPTMSLSSIAQNVQIDTIQGSEISITESIDRLCSLKTLNLSLLNISKRLVELGSVFSGCLKHSLTHLYLTSACLTGDIPAWIGDIKNLKVLDLSPNSLSGSVPSSLARLSFLQKLLAHLDLSYNQLRGNISEDHFTQLHKLETLDMSHNSLVFNVSSDWVPPFLLNQLRISSCSVGPEFPTWLQTQHKLQVLEMSHIGISDTMPDWLWNLISLNLVHLDLSYNQIQGMIPKFLTLTSMEYLDLSSNLLAGHVPDWLCQMEGLASIDISKNYLSGELPDCWSNSSTLLHINLAYNNISGTIPDSICHLHKLNSLWLSHNKLYGELPNSLKNFNQLLALDLSYNNITGSISTWSNAFVDHIPEENFQLKHLQILDLSSNNLSGPIPKKTFDSLPILFEYSKNMILNLRGGEDEYDGFHLGDLASLYGLRSLNLSGNILEGEIPDKLDLAFLDHFNLNTFSDPSIYIENHLCRFPQEPSDRVKDEGFVEFWTFLGALAFKKKWRHANGQHIQQDVCLSLNDALIVACRCFNK